MAKLTKYIHFRLSENALAALENASQKIGISKAMVVRIALNRFLADKGYLRKD